MSYKIVLVLVCFLMFCVVGYGQTDNMVVQKPLFNTKKYAEFSPVYFNRGIVFCSNRGSSGLVNSSGTSGSGQSDIFFVSFPDINKKGKGKSFSKQLNSRFNDGPVSFSADFNSIYFSRNIYQGSNKGIKKKDRNKLGIFSAELKKKQWENIKDSRFNSEWHNYTTPCLSPDGKRLYFSSDMPGGYGGMDLYYCELSQGFLGNPINLGENINSDGNEIYPFANSFGEFFFSSDGHPGLGGKDVFVTMQDENGWNKPVRLDAPINSEYNDFGFIADSLFSTGYFTSDRDGNYDIFSFNTIKHPVWFGERQAINDYCVEFVASEEVKVDTIKLQYQWEFEDGVKMYGKKVKYCFDESGNHKVKFNIVDRDSKQLFFHKKTLEVKIEDKEQAFIKSTNYAEVAEQVVFDGSKTNYARFNIISYHWDLGDNTLHTGEKVTHSYKKSGNYIVKLSVIIQSKEDGKLEKGTVYKTLHISNDVNNSELLADNTNAAFVYKNKNVRSTFDVDSILTGNRIYKLEILKSKNRISLTDKRFDLLPNKYHLAEIRNVDDGTYSYFVEEQHQLESLYIAFKELILLGFNPSVSSVELTKPYDIKMLKSMKRFGTSSDYYFTSWNSITNNGWLMLDEIIDLLNENTEVKIEVRVHTDNVASTKKNKYTSQLLADRMSAYIVNAGINKKRVVSLGFGEELPIRTNDSESERKLNRRVEFRVVND